MKEVLLDLAPGHDPGKHDTHLAVGGPFLVDSGYKGLGIAYQLKGWLCSNSLTYE